MNLEEEERGQGSAGEREEHAAGLKHTHIRAGDRQVMLVSRHVQRQHTHPSGVSEAGVRGHQVRVSAKGQGRVKEDSGVVEGQRFQCGTCCQ